METNILKIALLLTGLTEKNKLDININNINKLKNIDIYVHTWNKISIRSGLYHRNLIDYDMHSIYNKISNLKDILIEDQSEIYNKYKRDIDLFLRHKFDKKNKKRTLVNSWYQIYSIHKVNDLKNKSGIKYDIIIRARLDKSVELLNIFRNNNITDIFKNNHTMHIKDRIIIGTDKKLSPLFSESFTKINDFYYVEKKYPRFLIDRFIFNEIIS